MANEYRKAYVYIQNLQAGILAETEDGYEFSYLPRYLASEEYVLWNKNMIKPVMRHIFLRI